MNNEINVRTLCTEVYDERANDKEAISRFLSWVSKVPRQEPSDADNDSAVYDDSSAETTTSDLSQLTTALQRDMEGKSYLFSQCPPVLIPFML